MRSRLRHQCRATPVIRMMLLFASILAIPGHPGVAQTDAPELDEIAAGCPSVASTPTFTITYGEVHLDGASAPVGAIVEAVDPRGNVAGCCEVTTAGHYGSMFI